jgi:signal transduction histidine kinase
MSEETRDTTASGRERVRISPPLPGGAEASQEAARSAQAPRARGHAFVLLRFTLIIATSYMVLSETGFSGLSPVVTALIVAAIASNVVIARFAPRWLERRAFTAGVLIADTAWITTALVLTGHFDTEFFYLYFFVLFLAAIGESLALIALGAIVVCSAYLYGLAASGAASVLSSASLIRIPFLFAVASFYGYLVDRVRRERDRARAEAESVRRLEEVRTGLELANERLEDEVEERRRVEERLRQANEQLAKLSELKSAFVSTVSHELRTPLTSIKNAIDLVRREQTGEVSEPQKRFLSMAQRNVGRLAVIINDLLDLSKIEAGKLEYNFEPVGLPELLDDLRATFVPQAAASSVELELAVDEPAPQVFADPQRLAQVLTNLVSNALKFTPAGGRVEVCVRPSGGWTELAVSDTGPGIPAEHRERIFEPFYQAEDCLTRTVQGTGLGLSIAREMVSAHGGELTLTSAEGLGSRFSVRLPADLDRAREAVAFEAEIREHRKYPFFGLLVIGWGPEAAELPPLADRESLLSVLLAVRGDLRQVLPRDCDLFTVQPAHRRLVLVLLATPREGTAIVRRRLERRLTETAIRIEGTAVPAPRVLGPAVYPDDGASGRELIQTCQPAVPARGALREAPEGEPHERNQDPGGRRREGRGGDGSVPAPPGGLRGLDGLRRSGGPGRRPGDPARPGGPRRDDAPGERLPRVAHAAGG